MGRYSQLTEWETFIRMKSQIRLDCDNWKAIALFCMSNSRLEIILQTTNAFNPFFVFTFVLLFFCSRPASLTIIERSGYECCFPNVYSCGVLLGLTSR